jgi:2,3,4,5-tetrahydropyridine-2-carboxylate N-succinyltransferase
MENRAYSRRKLQPLRIREVLNHAGKLRVAEPKGDGWQVNDGKKAVVMYLPIQKNGNMGSRKF